MRERGCEQFLEWLSLGERLARCGRQSDESFVRAAAKLPPGYLLPAAYRSQRRVLAGGRTSGTGTVLIPYAGAGRNRRAPHGAEARRRGATRIPEVALA